MTEKTEALRLADALDERVVPRWVHATGQTPRQSGYRRDSECVQAAAELRRLSAVEAQRDALLEACKTLVNLPETEDWIATLRLAVEQARAAIAKAEGEGA